MTVLMHDAADSLDDVSKEVLEKGFLSDLLYADDTLLIGAEASKLENFPRAVSAAGAD